MKKFGKLLYDLTRLGGMAALVGALIAGGIHTNREEKLKSHARKAAMKSTRGDRLLYSESMENLHPRFNVSEQNRPARCFKMAVYKKQKPGIAYVRIACADSEGNTKVFRPARQK